MNSRRRLLVLGVVLEIASCAACVNAQETLNAERLAGKSFQFRWSQGTDHGDNGVAILQPDGTIAGIASPNEATWRVNSEGHLEFRHRDGRVSTLFDRHHEADGLMQLEGPFLLRKGITHALTETAPDREFDAETKALNEKIRTYSTQRIVCLDLGEEVSFQRHRIKLVSVKETRDSVIDLVRRAEVVLEINEKTYELTCHPYTMPRAIDGIGIQVDTTSVWSPIGKRVQVSVWEGDGPLVNTERFGFPLQDYRLLSHGTQGYGEVVHLGLRDGAPKGQRFYHDYGFDMAGYEGRAVVVSCTDGEVVRLHPADRPWSVLIQDGDGLIWDYGHLDSIRQNVEVGAVMQKGQPIGILGKTGPSGNFAHLHVGVYLSMRDALAGKSTRRLNLYPWLMTAYRSQYDLPLVAAARPHHTVSTGERVVLDGSHSIAGESPISSCRWQLPEGEIVDGPQAEVAFEKPGVYVATLRVEDDRGRQDVDFCTVKVFTVDAPEVSLPAIFMTHHPARNVAPEHAVSFRFWLQADHEAPIHVDFGDGQPVEDYVSYTELKHTYQTPGLYVVTTTAVVDGIPTTSCQKIVVDSRL